MRGNSQFPEKTGGGGLLDEATGEPSTVRIELSTHLSDHTLFRRAFISLDWVPRGICTKVMGYVGWEDEGLSIRWLWPCGCVDANPIEPGDEDKACERPC